MKIAYMLIFVLGLTAIVLFIIFILYMFIFRKRVVVISTKDIESAEQKHEDGMVQAEELISFRSGGDLTICDILDAPGEVIGKSHYGTLYKALLQRSGAIKLLRFLRPVCTTRAEEFNDVIHLLGSIRHPNLVPLLGFYGGPRGEKLLIHPFYRHGNLAQYLRDENEESHKWSTIYRISISIAKGLEYLHTGLKKPIIHGNLKSKNVFLDQKRQPYVSDFGIHLMLTATAGQEMLDALAEEGYKAPEHIKMKDASEETDIYSLGVILLELLSGKEPVNENATSDQDVYLPNLMRNMVLGHRISDMFVADIVHSSSNDESPVTEERILKFFQLAMACCSPSPSLRPNIKQVLWKLEQIIK